MHITCKIQGAVVRTQQKFMYYRTQGHNSSKALSSRKTVCERRTQKAEGFGSTRTPNAHSDRKTRGHARNAM